MMRERRTSPRRDHAACPRLGLVRVRPGRSARLLDISARGALIETVVRLLPGGFADLQIYLDGMQRTVRARIVRCRVSTLAPLQYRAGLEFADSVDLDG
jgi:hypothetical protein